MVIQTSYHKVGVKYLVSIMVKETVTYSADFLSPLAKRIFPQINEARNVRIRTVMGQLERGEPRKPLKEHRSLPSS